MVKTVWGQKYCLPNIWLDKACIDQTRIDESLAALPIFCKAVSSSSSSQDRPIFQDCGA